MMITSSAGPPDQGSVMRQEEGPFWVEAEGLERSDVTEGLMGYGLPLQLTMQVMTALPPPTITYRRSTRNIINSRASDADDDATIPSICRPISSNNYVSNAELLSSDDGMIVHPHDDMSDDDGMVPPHDDKLSHDDGMIPAPSCTPPHIHLDPRPPPSLRPLVNAQVHIWQCSFDGVYSGTATDSSSLGLRWLRGNQKTDAHGRVTFRTIYPGWYSRRAPHIHVRVRLFYNVMPIEATRAGNHSKEEEEEEQDDDDKVDRRFVVSDDTTQLYFDDALSDDIYAHVYPYNSRGQEQRVRNRDDPFFSPSNLIRNITRHNFHNQNYNTASAHDGAAAAAPAECKAYVVLRLPFQPLVPPPLYA